MADRKKYPDSTPCPDCVKCPECRHMVHASKPSMHHGACSQFSAERTYVGDGLYASFDGYQVELTTQREHRTRPGEQLVTDRVFLDREVLVDVVRYALAKRLVLPATLRTLADTFERTCTAERCVCDGRTCAYAKAQNAKDGAG